MRHANPASIDVYTLVESGNGRAPDIVPAVWLFSPTEAPTRDATSGQVVAGGEEADCASGEVAEQGCCHRWHRQRGRGHACRRDPAARRRPMSVTSAGLTRCAPRRASRKADTHGRQRQRRRPGRATTRAVRPNCCGSTGRLTDGRCPAFPTNVSSRTCGSIHLTRSGQPPLMPPTGRHLGRGRPVRNRYRSARLEQRGQARHRAAGGLAVAVARKPTDDPVGMRQIGFLPPNPLRSTCLPPRSHGRGAEDPRSSVTHSEGRLRRHGVSPRRQRRRRQAALRLLRHLGLGPSQLWKGRARSFGANGYHLGADDGDGYEFLNSLMIVKAAGEDTRGQLAVVEARTPPDYGPPAARACRRRGGVLRTGGHRRGHVRGSAVHRWSRLLGVDPTRDPAHLPRER